MRERLELPRLSLAERDRRWSVTREAMRARGIDCLVLWGWPAMWDFATANARYLCPIGGNAENNTLIFPLRRRADLVRVHADLHRVLEAGAGLGRRRARPPRLVGGHGGDAAQGDGAGARHHRHGWHRRSARSGRLGALQRRRIPQGGAAQCALCRTRQSPGVDARGKERGGNRAPGKGRRARRQNAASLPRSCPSRRARVRKSTAA